jgi:hypothetical protein
MDFGLFTFDLSLIFDFFSQSPFALVAQLFATVLWVPLVTFLLKEIVQAYHGMKVAQSTKDWKYTVLAIDIPQLNVQTPKAVEQLFSHLAGVFSKPDLRGKFVEGYRQKWFSFEVISIEGYLQFLVWTEEQYRDLMETAVYAQYPDAEITEVEDYTTTAPTRFPNKEYDMWAGDFALAENAAFPIRTYEEFEHSISKDTVLKDPMGTMLESFSRIGHGEQMWFQVIVRPIDNSWKESVIAKIKEFIGEEDSSGGGSKFGVMTDNFVVKEAGGLLQEASRQIAGTLFGGGESEAPAEVKKDKNQLKYMTPGQVKLVEAMEKKIQKIGYETNIRAVYLARKEVFNPSRGVTALIGSINQFSIPTANSIVVGAKAKSDKDKQEYIAAYRGRSMDFSVPSYVLNIEELATIWHFPMSHVKVPLLQKAANKAAEPPSGLPVEFIAAPAAAASTTHPSGQKKRIITDSGEEIVTDVEEYG